MSLLCLSFPQGVSKATLDISPLSPICVVEAHLCGGSDRCLLFDLLVVVLWLDCNRDGIFFRRVGHQHTPPPLFSPLHRAAVRKSVGVRRLNCNVQFSRPSVAGSSSTCNTRPVEKVHPRRGTKASLIVLTHLSSHLVPLAVCLLNPWAALLWARMFLCGLRA